MRTAIPALALALALAACGKPPEPRPEDIRPVRVLRIGAAETTRSFELAGEVRPRYETRLAFRVGGKIVERLVEVGTRVKAGETVARLDASDLALAAASARAQLASAEAERDLAAADHKRYQELRSKNFISQAEYDRRANAHATAEARLEAARAQLRQASNQVGYAVLAADTDGTDGGAGDPRDPAGAFVDPTTLSRARSIGLDPAVFLSENDATGFFTRVGDLLITGPTCTNINDFRAILVDRR